MLRFSLKTSPQRCAWSFAIALIGAGIAATHASAAQPIAQPIGVAAALKGEVVRTASFQTNAAIGQMSSGQQVFLGDDIKVGGNGRLQVMLVDETIFTLGANAVMRIDEFVYDPNAAENNTLTTSITQGAFRFVSGQVARRGPDAMTVKLPSATIGVRGTSVAGEVAPNGAAQVILLGPAIDNNLGLPAGAINVANNSGGVDITRPGFVTEIATGNVPPAPPQQATPAQIRNLEQALAEDALSELAQGLGVDSSDIIAQQGTDGDGDGQLDSFSANQGLSKAILAATGSQGGVTNEAVLVDQVATTLFGDGLNDLPADQRANMMRGINLGEDIGNLLAGDFEYLGPTNLSQLASFGPTGTVTFTGSGATMEDLNGQNVGSFSLTQVWDFASTEVSSAIGGQFDMTAGMLGQVSGSFDPEQVQTVSFAEASGGTVVTFNSEFHSFYDSQSNSVTVSNNINAQIGGDIGDINGTVTVSGQQYAYHPTGTDLTSYAGDQMAIHAIEERLTNFVSLDSATQANIDAMTSPSQGFMVNVMVGSFLSNVDRNDGTSPIASIGEGSVSVTVSETDFSEQGPPPVLNKAQGSIFAMQRSVAE
jgi:hypothetical protein